MWAKCATHLLDCMAWTHIFYSRKAHFAATEFQLWLVGGAGTAGTENGLEIHCLNIGLPQRGLSPGTETQPVGSVLGVEGLKTCLCFIK